jgi:hypothetical protein
MRFLTQYVIIILVSIAGTVGSPALADDAPLSTVVAIETIADPPDDLPPCSGPANADGTCTGRAECAENSCKPYVRRENG